MSVDISYVSNNSYWDAWRMDNLEREAFLTRIKAHKKAEQDAYEAEMAKARA